MQSASISIFAIIAIVLGVLKLCGIIALSWWRIAAIWLAPLVIVVVFFHAVMVIGALGLMLRGVFR